VSRIIEEEHSLALHLSSHALGEANSRERSGKNNAVKTGERSLNEMGISVYQGGRHCSSRHGEKIFPSSAESAGKRRELETAHSLKIECVVPSQAYENTVASWKSRSRHGGFMPACMALTGNTPHIANRRA